MKFDVVVVFAAALTWERGSRLHIYLLFVSREEISRDF